MDLQTKDIIDLIQTIAQTDLTLSNEQLGSLLRGVVPTARVSLQKIGPITRSAQDAHLHDDYLATQQFAVGIGHDGLLHTKQQTQCPQPYLIPLVAATQAMVNKLKREVAKKLDLEAKQIEDWIRPIINDIESEDFQRLWEQNKPDLPADQGGSRTKGAGKIVVPTKPRLQT